MTDVSKEELRELLRRAHRVRARVVADDRRLHLRDVYKLCYELARELRDSYADLRLTIGDLAGEQGLVQHFWIEIPSREIFIDAAADSLDPFQPIRVGRTTDPEFTSTYRNGQDANIDVDDPRNAPELLFKARSPWDMER